MVSKLILDIYNKWVSDVARGNDEATPRLGLSSAQDTCNGTPGNASIVMMPSLRDSGRTEKADAGERLVRITVQVSPEVARALHHRAPATAVSQGIARVLESLSVPLEPLHPDTDDEILSSYFAADVPDATAAQAVISQLRPLPGVQAAYVKPPDELP